jgi:hypothetical protein
MFGDRLHRFKRSITVCCARSVPESHLFGMKAVQPPKASSMFENVSSGGYFERWPVRLNIDYKWYYASNMMPEEMMFVKSFDSRKDIARRALHSNVC